MKFKVQYEDKAAKTLLKILGEQPPALIDTILAQAAEWVIANSQDKYLNALEADTAHLHSRTGRLSSSIHWWKEGRFEVWVGTGIEYAAIHEFGFAGKVQVKGYIRRADGVRIKSHAREMHMPARPYLLPSIRELWSTGAMDHLATNAIRHFVEDAERQAGAT